MPPLVVSPSNHGGRVLDRPSGVAFREAGGLSPSFSCAGPAASGDPHMEGGPDSVNVSGPLFLFDKQGT
jgi:hypothetical protein